MSPKKQFWPIGNEEEVLTESLRRLEKFSSDHGEDDEPSIDDHLIETFGPIPSGGIDATLAERGKRYGDFPGHARITQDIKRAMIGSGRWHLLNDSQRESLEMIAHKIGRILNGDPNYHDSWHDIVGYAKLVADKLAPRSGA